MGRQSLKLSPSFVLYPAQKGQAFVQALERPEIQYWLEPHEVLIFGLLASGGHFRASALFETLLRLAPEIPEAKLAQSLKEMQNTGILIDHRAETSRYQKSIVEAYLRHRPFPPELAQAIIKEARLGQGKRVLDLAGGPGDLATLLAQGGARVELADMSEGFLSAAKALALRRGVKIKTHLNSLQRLFLPKAHYDLITLSQAIHWLDPMVLMPFLHRSLRSDGAFILIQTRFELDASHPLADLFGPESRLGKGDPHPFEAMMEGLTQHLEDLSRVMEATEARPRPLKLYEIDYYRQKRPVDYDFARAFLTPAHLAQMGENPESFWPNLHERCQDIGPDLFEGHLVWAVARFTRDERVAKPSMSPAYHSLGFRPGEGI